MNDNSGKPKIKHERCISYVNRNGLIYVCGKWKGHYGRHRVSVSWEDKESGND